MRLRCVSSRPKSQIEIIANMLRNHEVGMAYLPGDDKLIGEFLDDVCRFCSINPDSAKLSAFALQLGENSLVFTKQLREMDAEVLSYLGMPENLVEPVRLALSGRLDKKSAAKFSNFQKPGEVKLMPIEAKFVDELPSYMAGIISSDSSYDADFDICKLCRNPFASGPKEMLDCVHLFCRTCLVEFIMKQVNSKSVSSLKCPVAKCNGDIPQNLIKSVLSAEEYGKYEEASISQLNDVFPCPNDQCRRLISMDSSKNVTVPKEITEKDDNGKILTREAFVHFSVTYLILNSDLIFCLSNID